MWYQCAPCEAESLCEGCIINCHSVWIQCPGGEVRCGGVHALFTPRDAPGQPPWFTPRGEPGAPDSEEPWEDVDPGQP